MAQTVQQHTKQLDSGDSDSTDYEWIAGGAASTQTLIQQAVIVNNDAVSQDITVKIKNTSSTAVLTIEHTIPAGASIFVAEIIGQSLDGHASTPETVSVQFGTALGASDTIDCRATSVKFS